MEKVFNCVLRESIIKEAKEVSESLISNFEEFYRFNKNTFHENYHNDLESLISNIEPTHFTKRNPALFKITEQAFSHIYTLGEFTTNNSVLSEINTLIFKIENTPFDSIQILVHLMEDLAILVYKKKDVLQGCGYKESQFFALLTIIASVRKEYSEKAQDQNTKEYSEKFELLQKEVKRIKVAANIIFAQRPKQLQMFTSKIPQKSSDIPFTRLPAN